MKQKTNKSNKRNLTVLAIVMLVNALSYGVIIPLLYPYASEYGITARGMSILFASFSLAQFVATPIIGRLSDRYGRKPLLLLSLLGTSLSLLLFGLAWSAAVLFLARILDGITGGNVSVAQAAIADSVPEKERAQAFGVLGAAFGIGFVLGPAIGGVLSQIDLSAPYFFSAGLALVGVLIGAFVFEETNVNREEQPKGGKLIDLKGMALALFSPTVGRIFWVSILSLTAVNAMIIGFQTITVDILGLSTFQIGLLFTLYGVVTVIMQGFGIKFLMQRFPSKIKLVQLSLVISGLLLFAVAIVSGVVIFAILILIFGAVNSPVGPVTVSLLSERSKKEDQGGVLGMNQSYTSIAQVVGPIMAGILLGLSVEWVFVFAGVMMFLAIIPSMNIGTSKKKIDL